MQLDNITLDGILCRLDASQKAVSALKSFSSKGWGNVVAWNPVASLVGSSGELDSLTASLERFIAKQQAAGNLLIGYLSYDFGCMVQGVELAKDNQPKTPLLHVASYQNWLELSGNKAAVHAKSKAYISEVLTTLNRPLSRDEVSNYLRPLTPVQSRLDYNRSYKRVEDYIVDGDIYQVNLSQRLEATTKKSGRDLFCSLSNTSRSDFQAYIEGQDYEILSYSPERFIQIQDQKITTMPIKGTRPRGLNRQLDEALKHELFSSPKERAELNMITDLMRNDLGAICQVGSVRVDQKRKLTAYPTLWHAHSLVSGLLKPELAPITALTSLMPGGSITGCPKKRAVEIISELETGRRGVYTGSIFTINPHGDLDSSIAIRTMIKCGTKLQLSVGGGIVYDSTEADEYQETLDKAASFLN